ncbi:MAG: hypothetical protein A3H69_02345 [Candidatus Sungbacteria bacterium RIFCSPLOWO2_02_FULL_47_9]|nr:MAG: Glycosyl transferase family 2 [Parcubacteria group bacterium GW2011_GWA2_47_10]OHA05645.1 MAG: hypothetical protein A3A28_04345 [Candidatus Sungbacteria bacterium RIFCSPLOWO2_01_FULL_47_32]OHA11533.1 MAG: hypothetical protein A3H69_02345 [Candidatus Sungbacteria bacterium RIFCSPLOWO2_02_FULL_47_9]
MLSDFFKTLRMLHRIQHDRASYRELIELLYNETSPEDSNFLRYNYAPHIVKIITYGHAQKTQPAFSVIIPTYNRCDLLLNTLNAIAGQKSISQNKPEVIVVDNYSEDKTEEGVAKFANFQEALHVIYIKLKKNYGGDFARNIGVLHSRGSLLVFTDDDCIVPPNWLSEFKRELDADPKIAGVGGFKIPRSTRERLDIYHRFVMWRHFLLPHERTKSPSIFYNRCGSLNANVCYRKSIFEKIGGFNVYFRHIGSRELKVRLHRSGAILLYEPRMVEHFAYFSFADYVRKLLIQGWDRYLLHVLHPEVELSSSFGHLLKRSGRDILVVFSGRNTMPFFNGSLPDKIGFSFISIITSLFLWSGKYWIPLKILVPKNRGDDNLLPIEE